MTIERKTLVGHIVTKADGTDDTSFGPHGGFDGILSHPNEDRDGETILSKDWEELPKSIPLNADHNMSLEGQIGSAEPYIKDGALRIKARFTSQPDAQRVRELINDGHVSTLSVEFLRKSSRSKDATGAEVETVKRELLGGAVTAYPSNTSAKILASKAGARNSKADQSALQDIHDHTQKLGAACAPADAAKSFVTKSTDDGDVIELTGVLWLDTIFEIDGKQYRLVGEEGPEMVVLPAGWTVKPSEDNAAEADSDADSDATATAVADDDDSDETANAAKSIEIRARALELQARIALLENN